MAFDSYVQVAVDGAGKLIDMEGVATDAGTEVYRQRATLVGPSAEAFEKMVLLQQQQLSVLRAILIALNATANYMVTEQEFEASDADFNIG